MVNIYLKQLIQFCTEYMQEYLHNACHTFFATTATPTNRPQRRASSNKPTWKHKRRQIRRDH